MINGTIKQIEEDDNSEYNREQMYWADLKSFEGVPYTLYGINDELDNLSKLIEVIGESVLAQEKDFKEISSEEEAIQNSFPTDKMIDNWHKKNYRSFSYKALLTVIHSDFEMALKDLFKILTEAKRINFKIKNDKLMDILKDFKALDNSLDPLILKAWPFNFIRNKVIHSNGYFVKTDKGYVEFERFIKDRVDIEVKQLPSTNSEFTHRVIIKQSSLLKDYIQLIREIISSLLKAAHNANYVEPAGS